MVGKINGEFAASATAAATRWTTARSGSRSTTPSLAGVSKTNPAVKITPSLIGNTWYLAIEGYNTRAKVQRVK